MAYTVAAMASARQTTAIPKSDLFPSRNDGFMTSQFNPPAKCTGRRFTRIESGIDLINFQGTIGWDFVMSDESTLTCSDKSWVSAQSKGQWPWTGQFITSSAFSAVGLCPSGYSIIGTRTNSEGTSYIAPGGSLVTEPATEAFCCPSGFSSACWTRTSVSYQSGSEMFGCETSVSEETEIFMVNGGGATSTMKTSSFKAYDRGYRVTWNTLQAAFFSPSTALASIASASPQSVDQNIYVTMCADGSLQTNSGGGRGSTTLSAGAIAGIVVGGLVVIFVGVGILAFYLWKKKKTVKQAALVQTEPVWTQFQQVPPQQYSTPPPDGISEMQAADQISRVTPMSRSHMQVAGSWRGQQELQTDGCGVRYQELHGMHSAGFQELPGNQAQGAGNVEQLQGQDRKTPPGAQMHQ